MSAGIKDWVKEEFETLDFNSKRLERRFKMAMSDLSEEPDKSIWLASGSRANAKAVYRMIANEKCDKESILKSHRDATGKKNKESILLAIQDTMSVNYSNHNKTEGLGYNCEKSLGVNCHNCILITPIGVPVGILSQTLTTRAEVKTELTQNKKQTRRIEEKESNRWLETMRTASLNAPEHVKLIHIADREGDIYELFALANRTGESFVIRAAHNRNTTDNEKIKETLNGTEAAEKIEVTIPANHSEKKKEREAILSIRYKNIEINKPKIRRKEKDLETTLTLNLISVKEDEPPIGDEAIEWTLLTNIDISTIEDAKLVINYYKQRWKIERFHYVLKSGCEIEKIQQRRIEGIELILLMYSIIAIRIMQLMYTSRTAPETPCELIFDEEEWKTLYRASNQTRQAPDKPYPISDAVRYVAKLGGFKGAKSDGEPGLKVIWIGLNKLFTLCAYREFI